MSEEYELPLDLQIEIMKRLPVKSLLKFRSVSKSWKSIIHSSQFIADYNSSHIQRQNLSFVGYDLENHVDIFDDDSNGSLQRLTLNRIPGFKSNQFIGYSQGLFGFQCCNNNNVTPEDVVVIWNPSIRKSVFIPVPGHILYQTHFVFTVCNATGPTIFITYIVGSPWRQVEIFTLRTGVWRTLSNAPPRESLRFRRMRVVIDNRFIYWIVSEWNPEGDCLDKLILSFDITREQFTELCLPPTLAPHTSFNRINLSKLRESLVVLESDICKEEIGVWMMMMEPGVQYSFTKLYTLKPPYRREFPTVLGFRKNGQPIIYSDFPTHEQVLFYESDLERFNDYDISGYGDILSTAGSYMETLLLLDH